MRLTNVAIEINKTQCKGFKCCTHTIQDMGKPLMRKQSLALETPIDGAAQQKIMKNDNIKHMLKEIFPF